MKDKIKIITNLRMYLNKIPIYKESMRLSYVLPSGNIILFLVNNSFLDDNKVTEVNISKEITHSKIFSLSLIQLEVHLNLQFFPLFLLWLKIIKSLLFLFISSTRR